MAQYNGLVINEFLANPKSGISVHVDSNSDGQNDIFNDEFVELLNTSTNTIDVTGLIIFNATQSIRHHVFTPRLLPPGGSIVVFGGGSLLEFTNLPAQRASSGSLGLNNDTDSIVLYSPQTTLVDQVSYVATVPAASSVRNPEGTGAFASHLALTTNSSRASPGQRTYGSPYLTNQPPVILEMPDQTAFVGLALEFPVRARDPADGHAITLTVSGAPTNSSLVSTNGNGSFAFTPAPAQTGEVFQVSFIATDADGAETGIVTIAVVSPITSEDVWINEFHYDNAGTDSDEGVEVAGTAGTVLTNYSIVLYNGSSGLRYDTQLLSGTLDNEQCGFGAAWIAYGVNGLQNETEGIALVKGTNVIQFLSYEGTFTASDGPAAGLTSTDVVVEETGTTPVGFSLQLQGTGTQYAAYTWIAPQSHTRDTLNTNQAAECFVPADLAIQKTVYLGHDGGASFPGFEMVQGTNGAPVTYLFHVQNTGGSTLTNVSVEDTALGITPIPLGTLLAGESRTTYVESVVSGDLRNTATAGGYDALGNAVADSDSADVVLIIPLIEVQKTVYRGHDGGASCPGGELVMETNGAPVTYCFRIANNGTTNLTSVQLQDTTLGLPPVSFGTLAAGDVVFTSFAAFVTANLTNTAVVTGNDPNNDPVADEDTAEVRLIQPAIQIQKTVYSGHDGGASCPGAEIVLGSNGVAVTYCFEVANVGDIALTNVTVFDPFLGATNLLVIPTLGAGQTNSFHVESTITTSFVNSASVTGFAPNGYVVVAQDTAEVVLLPSAPECGSLEVIDLGTLGGVSSVAFGINDLGHVVGQAALTSGALRAFIWKDGVMSNLFTVGGLDSSAAYDINRHGHIVGNMVSNGLNRGFVWSTGTVATFATSPVTFVSTFGAINNSNVAAAHLVLTNTPPHPHPAYVKDGAFTDLGTFSTLVSGGAFDINDLGMIVGYAHIFCPSDCWDPFIWVDANTNGLKDSGEFISLGSLGGNSGTAQGINNVGQVVGSSETIGYTTPHAFLVSPVDGMWDDDNNPASRVNTLMQDLGTLGGAISEAHAINDAGDVVGYAWNSNSQSRAFLYSVGEMIDLNSLICPESGWVLHDAHDINNSGQIVGWGVISGAAKGFLLDPTTNVIEMVRISPEARLQNGQGLVQWRGTGFQMQYTLQSTTNLVNPAWQPVTPTGQWPTLNSYWIGDETNLIPSTRHFRVIGQ